MSHQQQQLSTLLSAMMKNNHNEKGEFFMRRRPPCKTLATGNLLPLMSVDGTYLPLVSQKIAVAEPIGDKFSQDIYNRQILDVPVRDLDLVASESSSLVNRSISISFQADFAYLPTIGCLASLPFTTNCSQRWTW